MYVSALRRLSRARMHLVELRRPRRAPVSTGGLSTRTRKTVSDGVQLKRIRPRIRLGSCLRPGCPFGRCWELGLLPLRVLRQVTRLRTRQRRRPNSQQRPNRTRAVTAVSWCMLGMPYPTVSFLAPWMSTRAVCRVLVLPPRRRGGMSRSETFDKVPMGTRQPPESLPVIHYPLREPCFVSGPCTRPGPSPAAPAQCTGPGPWV